MRPRAKYHVIYLRGRVLLERKFLLHNPLRLWYNELACKGSCIRHVLTKAAKGIPGEVVALRGFPFAGVSCLYGNARAVCRQDCPQRSQRPRLGSYILPAYAHLLPVARVERQRGQYSRFRQIPQEAGGPQVRRDKRSQVCYDEVRKKPEGRSAL